MNEHLSTVKLAAIADGELTQGDLISVNDHLAACPVCTSKALSQSLLKSATARAGQRYDPPSDLQERLRSLTLHDRSTQIRASRNVALIGPIRFHSYGWLAACALLVVCFGVVMMQRSANRKAIVSAETSALAMEAADQHIATLASNAPPQVISSDRHTVKPWFQGKLPFSFNLPENLPAGTNLIGANLAYVHDQPAAQLLYSIGNHRASVYLKQRLDHESVKLATIDQTGFHVIFFAPGGMSGVAVSDVDSPHLSDLVSRITQAQTK